MHPAVNVTGEEQHLNDCSNILAEWDFYVYVPVLYFEIEISYVHN